MNLPVLEFPIYELTFPISKQKIKFRPFLVREQKLLLLSKENDDEDFISNNIKELLRNCCLSDNIDIEKLSSVDIEYFFLQLRARSVGEISKLQYRCNNVLSTGESCNNLMDVDVNLLEVELDLSTFSDIVQLTDTVGIKLKYPDFNSLTKFKDSDSIVDITFEIIYKSIDYIFDDDNFYYPNETPKKEIMNFLDTLNMEQYAQIEMFFQNLPVLKKDVSVTCNKCSFKHKITIEGLKNFLE